MHAYEMCATRFAKRHPAEAAAFLEPLPPADVAMFLKAVSPELGSALLRRLNPASAAACLEALDVEQAAALVTELPRAVAASVLRRLTAPLQSELMGRLTAPVRQALERGLRFAEGTVGAAADVAPPAFASHLPVAEVRRLARRPSFTPTPYLFVTDDAHKLVGVIHMRDLAAARGRATLASIMHSDVISVSAHADLATVAAHAAWRDHDWLPVVDRSGALVGVIGHRRLRQLAEPGGAGSLVEALFHLGELYWQGVSMFMPDLTPRHASAGDRSSNAEIDDARQ
jgi:magnesium transporter